MASAEAVAVAAILHMILRVPLRLSCDARFPTSGPSLPTHVVCIGVLSIIYCNRVLPHRFYDCSMGLKCFIESSIAVGILELCMGVWASVELLISLIISEILVRLDIVSKDALTKNECVIIGSFTIPLALMMLFTAYQVNTEIHRQPLTPLEDENNNVLPLLGDENNNNVTPLEVENNHL